jgi:hypothetical protein
MLLLIFVESLLEIGFSVLFSLMCVGLAEIKWTGVIYLYFAFSYAWISITISYVVYLTISGLAASWYFLNDTEYMPSSPVLQSLKRALTTSFGSACLAAFLLAVVQTLRAIAESNSRSSGQGQWFIVLIRCIALCLLAIIECIVKLVTRYALIYCATFGLSFVEGCKRWLDLDRTRFVELLVGGVCINIATSYNMVIFAVGSALLGYGVGYLAYSYVDDSSSYILCDRTSLAIFVAVFACLFSFALFAVLSEPVVTLSDTLLVCFVERPDRLRTSASELYDLLSEFYASELEAAMRSQRENQ